MSDLFELASRYVDDACELSPLLASSLGLSLNPHWDDFGPEGVERWRDLRERYQGELSSVEVESSDARLGRRVMETDLAIAEERYSTGDHLLDLRHMASKFQQIRSSFQTLPSETQEGRTVIEERLRTINQPLEGLRALYQHALDQGKVVSKRQVRSVVAQARRLASDESSLNELPVDSGLDAARAAYGSMASWLEAEYLPHAKGSDGVGRDVYERAANVLVGRQIDPLETYEWGWEEFYRLRDEMTKVADQVVSGASVLEAKEHLETHPSAVVRGEQALLEFVADVLADAKERLAGVHFDLPSQIHPLTVQMAPKGGPLGVYYMRPSEDFVRPGGVWYSTGDQTTFPLYQHRSTAYHEGFPGHHLQIASMMLNSDRLSRYQRLMTWCPGYGEGWAMYSEVLMGELGFLEHPGDYFGMLAKQMYRASRVVVDIGLHLGLTIDARSPLSPGEQWTFENASEFMEVYGFRTGAQARDEVLRYLGWPGQAIAYKVGEREILRLRERARAHLGGDFSLDEFHRAVLGTGTVRMDILEETISERLF